MELAHFRSNGLQQGHANLGSSSTFRQQFLFTSLDGADSKEAYAETVEAPQVKINSFSNTIFK